MKVSIVYYSKTGNTHAAAELIKEGILKYEGIEVKLMNLQDGDVDNDYINESQAVIFGTPTYYANMAWQVKRFLDESPKYDGKLAATFATANGFGGGAEVALLTIAGHALAKGMLMYSGGTAKGQPFTHLGAVLTRDGSDSEKERAVIFGERIGAKLKEIF